MALGSGRLQRTIRFLLSHEVFPFQNSVLKFYLGPPERLSLYSQIETWLPEWAKQLNLGTTIHHHL